MKKILSDFIYYNGIKEEYPPGLKIHIRNANLLILLYLALSIPFIFLNLQNLEITLFRSIVLLPAFLTWFFLRIGWQQIGRIFSAFIFPTIIYILGSVMHPLDKACNISKVWLVSSAVLPFLVLKLDEWKYIIALLVLDLFYIVTFDKVNHLINIPYITTNLDRPVINIFAITGSFFLVIISVFYLKKQLFSLNRELYSKNRKLEQLLNKVETAQNELRQANNELSALNDEINSQKIALEKTLNNLHSSLVYAKTIQKAIILPRLSKLDKYLSDYFLIFQPKEEVGGDFIFVEELDRKLAIVVGDATGHGIPGALMSMLAIMTMDFVIKDRSLENTAQKLDKAKEIVIDTLQQHISIAQDGFDAAFLIFDPKTKIIQFTGANLTLYKYFNGKIIAYKGDRMPVGNYYISKTFTNYNIHIQEGDIFYVFTDGYPDQFGGPFNKKFSKKRLLNTLASIAKLPMNEQKQILLEIFDNWKKSNEQIDDVTVFGFKI